MSKIGNAEPKTPHLLCLEQNILAWSQEEECGLKYVIHIPGDQTGLQIIKPTLTFGSVMYVEHMLTNQDQR
jgi:hypothetical protein